MNKVILMGRLTRDPDIRWSQGQDQKCTARFTLAVDRRFSTENGPTADFISCVTFGKIAEFGERYLRQGIKVVATGRIQTGSYTNREGQKVYTTDVVIEEMEFAESKAANEQHSAPRPVDPQSAAGGYGQRDNTGNEPSVNPDGFMNIPDGIDEGLPFS